MRDIMKHTGSWATCKLCDALVIQFEREGMDTSDAQGCAMAAHMQATDKKAEKQTERQSCK